MAETDVNSPPYLSFATFTSFLKHLKGAPPIPNVIDQSVMSKMARSVQSQMLPALRFFNLTEGKNASTSELELAVNAVDTADWKRFVKANLYPCYAAITGSIDLEKTTQTALLTAFGEHYGFTGETKEKAVRFFVSLLEDAEIQVSQFIKTRNAPASGPRASRKRKANGDRTGDSITAEGATDHHAAPGMISYPIHVPGKPTGRLVIPDNLTSDEVRLVELQIGMLKAYADLREGKTMKT
jgi:hypothetical protein